MGYDISWCSYTIGWDNYNYSATNLSNIHLEPGNPFSLCFLNKHSSHLLGYLRVTQWNKVSNYFERWSTTTSKESAPLDLGSPPMKSTAISSHILFGIDKGHNCSTGWRVGYLFSWHARHQATNSWTSLYTCFPYRTTASHLQVLVVLKCPPEDVAWNSANRGEILSDF